MKVLLCAVAVLAVTRRCDANRNAVGQTPIMGWSGYNAFMQNSGHCDKAGAGGYNETTFVQTMEAMASNGLRDAGYVYLNADDCWIAENRTKDGELAADKTRFPHGMKWLVDAAHARTLKLGLYAAASLLTCRSYPGSQGFEEKDAALFASYGADFAKLDSCGGSLPNGTESWYNQYGRWSDAMNASGTQMVFSCSWAVYFTKCAASHPPQFWVQRCGPMPWSDQYIADKCHMWRYGEDLAPIWTSGSARPGTGGSGVGDIIDFASSIYASSWRSVSTVGAFNDPDFLVVGCPLDRPCESPSEIAAKSGQLPLNRAEQQTQMSMWCILQAPLIIGSDVRDLPRWALDILLNKDAIAIDQDVTPGQQPRLVSGNPGTPGTAVAPSPSSVQIWARGMKDGTVAVAIVNMDNSTSHVASLSLADVFCAGCNTNAATIFDVWSKKTSKVSHIITLTVGPHETRLVRVSSSSGQD